MSIEVMGGGGGYPEYKRQWCSATTITSATTTFDTESFSRSMHYVNSMYIIGEKYEFTSGSGTTVSRLFSFGFPFQEWGWFSVDNKYTFYGSKNCQVEFTYKQTTGGTGYVTINNLYDEDGNIITFYPGSTSGSTRIRYYYSVYFYGYNLA